jgi:hypothetical protein
LSEGYSSAQLVEIAAWVKRRHRLLISDNGNFTRMKNIARRYERLGAAILNRALEEQQDGGGPRTSSLGKRDRLIKKIEIDCAAALKEMPKAAVVQRQLQINPDYMIALEDFTIPVLMMCGLLHPVFKPSAPTIKKFQDQTASLYRDQRRGKFGSKGQLDQTHKFLVIHAYDYASAAQGAAQTFKIKPDGVAISYGAPMNSKRWITSLDFGRSVEKFDEKLPEPYLISTAITLGMVNGAGSRAGVPVHILGVGSPILVALIGQLLRRSRAVSIDSTAPFKDANVGVIYGSKSAFLKMDMYKVAAHALIEDRPFTSTTPFYKQFEHDFPSNWKALRAELGVTTSTDVGALADQLEAQAGIIERYIPFFAKMRSGDDEMMRRLRMDRAGHNYWVLKNICASIRNRIDDPKKIEAWMQLQVKRYKVVASDKWSKAIEVAFELSKKYLK